MASDGGQFARVVKGVDLRSTAGNCAWVRTPQLSLSQTAASVALFMFPEAKGQSDAAIAQLGERQTEDLEVPGSIPGLGSFTSVGICQAQVQYVPSFANSKQVTLWPSG